jgi:signal transduction histidine kinase
VNDELSRLQTRLQLSAIGFRLAWFVTLVLLAPGVLLLEPEVAIAALVECAWLYPAVLLVGAITTWLRLRPFAAALRSIGDERDAQGSQAKLEIDPELAHRLHAVPLSWIVLLGLQSAVLAALTLAPFSRPSLIDMESQIGIVALAIVLDTATAIPLYVVARALVGRTLEAIPWRVAEEAMAREQESELTRTGLRSLFGTRGQRVRQRMLLAVVLPVGLVAFGAALLANAHVRAYETRHRRDDAWALARGVLEPETHAGTAGRDAAVNAVSDLGFGVTFERSERSADDRSGDKADTKVDGRDRAQPSAGGMRTLRTKLEDGFATVRFEPTMEPLDVWPYLFAAAAAIGIAALFGRAIGSSVSSDLGGATREVRLLGTREVLRGETRVAGPARFGPVAELGMGIERVAERFREFARGREREIDARESAQRMRDLFLASMSHDLRSPLNGILGFVAILQKSTELAPTQHESLAIIERRGRELLELIENILDAAKIEADRLELSPDYIEPSEIVAEIVRRGRELALEKHAESGQSIDVVGELDPGLGAVWIDGARVTQATWNLVSNAVKFVDHGTIRVRFARGRGERGEPILRIEIVDAAGAIPEKDLAQIVDVFHEPLRSRRHGGFGLGLSLTRALVELHGGKLAIESSPERGSVFTLRIPLEVEPLAPTPLLPEVAPRASAPPPPPSSRRPTLPPLPPEPAVLEQEVPTVQMPALELALGPDVERDSVKTPLPIASPFGRTPVPPRGGSR